MIAGFARAMGFWLQLPSSCAVHGAAPDWERCTAVGAGAPSNRARTRPTGDQGLHSLRTALRPGEHSWGVATRRPAPRPPRRLRPRGGPRRTPATPSAPRQGRRESARRRHRTGAWPGNGFAPASRRTGTPGRDRAGNAPRRATGDAVGVGAARAGRRGCTAAPRRERRRRDRGSCSGRDRTGAWSPRLCWEDPPRPSGPGPR